MPTPELLAVYIASLKNAVKLRLWSSPLWVEQLLTAYEDAKKEAAAWRRTYNQVSDQYRDLLASKPEVYLVEGHDAAYWARQCTLASDVSRVLLNNNASMITQHKALSADYLALRNDRDLWMARDNASQASLQAWRTKYDRLQRVATGCEEELRDIRLLNS